MSSNYQNPRIDQNKQQEAGQTKAGYHFKNQIFEAMEQAKKTNTKFLKLESGQSVIFTVDPTRISIEKQTFDGKTRNVGQYFIKLVGDDEEKILQLSLSWCTPLNMLIDRGFYTVEMTRTGAGRDNTSYSFVPVVDKADEE